MPQCEIKIWRKEAAEIVFNDATHAGKERLARQG